MSLGLTANRGLGIYLARPIPHGSVSGYGLLCVFHSHRHTFIDYITVKQKKGLFRFVCFAFLNEYTRVFVHIHAVVGKWAEPTCCSLQSTSPIFTKQVFLLRGVTPAPNPLRLRQWNARLAPSLCYWNKPVPKRAEKLSPTRPLVFNITVREAGTGETHYCYAGKSSTTRKHVAGQLTVRQGWCDVMPFSLCGPGGFGACLQNCQKLIDSPKNSPTNVFFLRQLYIHNSFPVLS